MTPPRSSDGKKRVCELGGEGFELGSAFGRRRDLFRSADKPVAVSLDHARAWLTAHKIGRLAVELKVPSAARCQQRAAISFANADEILIEWEGDDLEASRAQLV